MTFGKRSMVQVWWELHRFRWRKRYKEFHRKGSISFNKPPLSGVHTAALAPLLAFVKELRYFYFLGRKYPYEFGTQTVSHCVSFLMPAFTVGGGQFNRRSQTRTKRRRVRSSGTNENCGDHGAAVYRTSVCWMAPCDDAAWGRRLKRKRNREHRVGRVGRARRNRGGVS